MSKLDELNAVYEKAKLKAKEAAERINEGYKQLIYKILGFYSELADSTLADREWYNRDRLCIEIEKERDFRVEVEIKKSSVVFNNCCSGDWVKGSAYHEYIKMHVILADYSEEILAYANSVDRTDLLAAHNAGRAVSDEEENISLQDAANRLKAREEELKNADYIAIYSKYNPQSFATLYKILKITEKQVKVEVYRYTSVSTVWESDPFSRNKNLDKKDVIYWDKYKFIKQEDLDEVNRQLKQAD